MNNNIANFIPVFSRITFDLWLILSVSWKLIMDIDWKKEWVNGYKVQHLVLINW